MSKLTCSLLLGPLSRKSNYYPVFDLVFSIPWDNPYFLVDSDGRFLLIYCPPPISSGLRIGDGLSEAGIGLAQRALARCTLGYLPFPLLSILKTKKGDKVLLESWWGLPPLAYLLYSPEALLLKIPFLWKIL